MRKGPLAGLLLVVCGAALGATVLHEPIATAASPFTNVIIGNTSDSPVPVAEQNRDGNGNIRVHEQGTAAVHEQGTASVSVTNSSIPVTGTVNIGNGAMRQMHVASNVTLPKNFALNTGFQDTSDCRALAAFIKPASSTSTTPTSSSGPRSPARRSATSRATPVGFVPGTSGTSRRPAAYRSSRRRRSS